MPATVGVQLIEHQELEILRRFHERPILAAGQQQLEHHVIRQQDVRRVAANRLALVAFLLPGVARETHGRLTVRVAHFEELSQFLVLAVRQRIHGIDDNGLDAVARPAPQYVVHRRHDVSHALAGAGAARQDVRFPFLRLSDRLHLVRVEHQRLADRIRRGLLDAEDPRALRMQRPVLDELIDCPAREEGRVQLEERLGPQSPRSQRALDLAIDPRISNLDEASGVTRIVVDQSRSQIEYVHFAPSPPPAATRRAFHGGGPSESTSYQRHSRALAACRTEVVG